MCRSRKVFQILFAGIRQARTLHCGNMHHGRDHGLHDRSKAREADMILRRGQWGGSIGQRAARQDQGKAKCENYD